MRTVVVILSWRSHRILTKLEQNFPESFVVDGVEGLSQVSESLVKHLVLFLVFCICRATKAMSVVPRDVLKPHWLSGSMSSVSGSKRLRRTRASIFIAMGKGQCPGSSHSLI